MKRFASILLVFTLLGTACGKKSKDPGDDPEEPIVTPTPENCKDIPPPPSTFGWADSIVDGNKNVNAFFYNPINNDQIIYVVNGDQFGFNKMIMVDLVSQQSLQLGLLGPYLPQVNKQGWIVYSDVNNNIVLVNSNGQHQKTLVSGNRAHDPKWDFAGTSIYYYVEAAGSSASQMVKIDTAGIVKDIFPTELPYSACFKKSNKLLFIKVNGTNCALILKDVGPPAAETEIMTAPLYSKPGQIFFDNLTLDNNDEYFYWSNSNGIFRRSFTSTKIDTIKKSCQSSIHDNPIISFKANELTYSHHAIVPANSFKLLHTYKAIDLNLLNMQTQEVRIFP